jgi:CheY-like chemotaxis protein
LKADQIRATAAEVVVTSCHNCVDGLADLIKHYELGCEVKQLVNLVANALVLEESVGAKEEKVPEIRSDEAAEELPLAGRTILVVDDEEDIRTYLVTVFEDAGATVLEAEDGDEAIEVALRERPDLITLDLSMPGKDGVHAFVELRSTDEIATTPVCVITGHPEFRKVIYERPVPAPEGYLNKPVDEDKLLDYVAHILDHADEKRH